MNIFQELENMTKRESSIFTYQLVDGSYIMAEEVDFDFDENVIFIINPVRIKENNRDNKFQLTTYMITEPSHPIQLREDAIVASTPAPAVLRRNYFQYNLLNALQNSLSNDDFKEIVKLIFGGLDSKDDVEKQENNPFDFSETYKIKKSKNSNNPWDRY